MRCSIRSIEPGAAKPGKQHPLGGASQRAAVSLSTVRRRASIGYRPEFPFVGALGATALQSLSTYKGTLTNARKQTLQTHEGAALRVTVHPSYLLRLPDADAKEAEFARFVEDLRAAKHVAEHMRAA